MDYSKSEKLFNSIIFKYISRIFILHIFSAIFKSFDMTFTQSARSGFVRSHVFSIIYVIFGLLVWEGAAKISTRIEKKFLSKSSYNRLLLLCGAFLLYGVLASFAFGFIYAISDIVLFNRYEAWESFRSVSYDMIFGTFLFYVIILTFNGIIFYYKEWKENQLHTERLMRENMQAKYEALRNQIDPHFFFNSLSVLTNLVYKNPDTAADYITQLAKTYRYVLDKKFENLVSLQTELDFLESYLFLIRIRHQNSIKYTIHINEKIKNDGLIPPAALQMLFENAIKHNRFSALDPLIISLSCENDYLLIKNKLNKKTMPEISSGIGLENIEKRYELVSNKSIHVYESNGEFIVKLPIIY